MAGRVTFHSCVYVQICWVLKGILKIFLCRSELPNINASTFQHLPSWAYLVTPSWPRGMLPPPGLNGWRRAGRGGGPILAAPPGLPSSRARPEGNASIRMISRRGFIICSRRGSVSVGKREGERREYYLDGGKHSDWTRWNNAILPQTHKLGM